MFYIFDNAGWYVGTSETEVPRSVPDVPGILETELIENELRSNWTGFEWRPMHYVPPRPETAGPKRITKTAFRMRFTAAEKVALELASIDNPAGTIQQRMLAASLRVNMADQRDATYIDLSRTDTQAGVRSLETFGLIAPGRADIILNTPIAPHEVPEVFVFKNEGELNGL